MAEDRALQTNIEMIESLAEARWVDNWNFRAYLKAHVTPQAVDSAAHRLNGEIARRIDCTTCANCCRGAGPSLTGADVARAAKATNLSTGKFERQFLKSQAGEKVFRATPCPLLKDSLCTIYANRPADCRTYPHLDEPDFLLNSVATIENYRVCPIVFNVYERLKGEFAYDAAVDYVGDADQED